MFGMVYFAAQVWDSHRDTTWASIQSSVTNTLYDAFDVSGLPVEIVSVEDGERNAVESFSRRKAPIRLSNQTVVIQMFTVPLSRQRNIGIRDVDIMD